jgi:hypothetical protein
VPDIKAAEDLNLWPVTTTPASFVGKSLLHAPHKPSDLTPTKLIVFPIWRRKAKSKKPVSAIVMQVMGNFIPEVFENPMFCDVIIVLLCRLGGPNLFPQGCKPIVMGMIVTAMQTMSYPVRTLRSLCPSPDIALECIC